jgi:hypothetical protein
VIGGHHERVRAASRGGGPTGADHVLPALDVEQDLALDDVQGLIHIGVKVHRRDLAADEVPG